MRRGGASSAPRPDAAARGRSGVVLVALLVAFVAVTVVVGAHLTRGVDTRSIAWVVTERTDGALTVSRVMNAVGGWRIMTPLVVGAAVLLLAFRRRRDAAYLLATMAASGALHALIKLLIRRSRPLGAPEGIQPGPYGFPSGHTMSATAFTVALVLIAWPTRWRTPVLVAGSVFALTMGVSRVALAVHWPSDVAAGWILGAAVAVALRLALYRDGPAASAAARPARPGPASGPVDVVFLDWGGTLMVDDGTQRGPMATWPSVAAVDGAQSALETLRPHHVLIVATNADDSGARDVRAALYRADLDVLIDDVVSSRDVGARKPDAFFYRTALLRAGRGGLPLDPARAVMVGDSWFNDVAGARNAGLRAIWFNPGRASRPPGAEPPDAEIARLADLPAAVAHLEGGAAARPVRGPAPPP